MFVGAIFRDGCLHRLLLKTVVENRLARIHLPRQLFGETGAALDLDVFSKPCATLNSTRGFEKIKFQRRARHANSTRDGPAPEGLFIDHCLKRTPTDVSSKSRRDRAFLRTAGRSVRHFFLSLPPNVMLCSGL